MRADRTIRLLFFLLTMQLLFVPPLHAQTEPDSPPEQKMLTLVRAVMCEEIRSYAPFVPAIVFSIRLGKVYCYTEFDPVPEKSAIVYRWYRRDILVTTRRVELFPPRWSTYSSIQLREIDKGPWRVEVDGPGDTPLTVLRFSITD